MCLLRLLVVVLVYVSVGLSAVVLAAEPSTRPMLRIEPQLHFAAIRRMDVDAAERFVVTASDDKTARVWDVKTGELLQVLRPPMGEGNEGKLYAVAISPDGELVAVAGFTGITGFAGTESIYIFQRQTGQLQHRIQGLPNVINHLAFAADGNRLAVALGEGGIRVYERGTWDELARDSEYGADSYSVDFDSTGRLVSTSWDGYVRLYDKDLKLLQRYQTQGGQRTFFAKFSPDAQQIAVGFDDSTDVELLDAKTTLKLSYALDTQEIDNGNLGILAWSQDGKHIYAGGRYWDGQGIPLLVWDKAVRGQRRIWQAGHNALMDIKPLRDGGVLYASSDPSLGRLTAQGEKLWQQGAGTLDFTYNDDRTNFALNEKGGVVHLYYHKTTLGDVKTSQVVFNLSELTLSTKTSAQVFKPRLEANGLTISDWMDTTEPKLNGQALPLDNYEESWSLAIDAKGKSFALGADWSLRLYNAEGELQWHQAVPNAFMVNISQDDRWVVAALGNGTVRWYEKATGTERLAFYLHPDEKRWVAWTPEGFYATSSPDAENLIGYHINQGADREAKWVSVQQLREVFARADLVSKALDDDYTALAAKALQDAGSIDSLLAKILPQP